LVLPVLPGTAAATGACAIRFSCKLQFHSSSHNDEGNPPQVHVQGIAPADTQ
jgi:hypothetical protein